MGTEHDDIVLVQDLEVGDLFRLIPPYAVSSDVYKRGLDCIEHMRIPGEIGLTEMARHHERVYLVPVRKIPMLRKEDGKWIIK